MGRRVAGGKIFPASMADADIYCLGNNNNDIFGWKLLKLTKKYGKPNVPKMSEIHHDTKDHDYYDD